MKKRNEGEERALGRTVENCIVMLLFIPLKIFNLKTLLPCSFIPHSSFVYPKKKCLQFVCARV